MSGHDGYGGPLCALVTSYIERVVNQRDLTAVDDLVSPDYSGSGPEWATDIHELRRFYEDQVRDRPDWHIGVQSTVELGDSVVVRAQAGGTVTVDGKQRHRRLEWLTHYRVTDGLITEINILSFVPMGADQPA
jgi:hypothetical protein